MEFKDVIQNRYSCKDFSTQQIEKEKLMEILEAGRVAPTAKNLQEQKIYVVQSKEYLDKIDACTPCRYHAPTVLVGATLPASNISINFSFSICCVEKSLHEYRF